MFMKKLSSLFLNLLLLQFLSSSASQLQIFNETFYPTNTAQWTSIQGGAEASSCGWYAYQDAMYFSGATERYAETVDLNLTFVDEVSFQLFISYYSASGCDVANSGDDIYLEYSTDAGITWNSIQTFKAYTYTYSYFTATTAYLPSAAKKSKVRLKWSQTKFTGSGYDVWGLDEITMEQNCTPFALPTIAVNGNTQICDKDTVKLTASSQSNVFYWNTGETTNTIKTSTVGNYYVLSADKNGCLAYSDTVEVTSAKPPVIAYSQDPSVCVGGNTQLNVAISGNYTENFDPINKAFWNTISLGLVETGCGGTSNALYFYDAGTYLDDRYAITNDLDLSAGGNMQFDLYIDYTYTCEAADYGEDVYFDYSTDGGKNWNSVSIYYASIPDYDPFKTISVSLPAAAQTSHTRLRWYQSTYTCQYCDYWAIDNIKISSVDTNLSSKPYTYKWSPSTGLSNTTIANPTASSVNSSIIYTVIVTDTVLGCATTDTASITVFTPSTASITVKGATTICMEDTTALIANTAKYYLWSNGDTNQTAYVSDAGSYTVTVIYPGGCSSTSNPKTISQYPSIVPVITASGPTDFCFNDSVTLSSSTALVYFWSTGESTQSITVHNTGKYALKVFDSYGCFLHSDSIKIVNHGPVTRILADTNAICKGGSLDLTVKVGGSNYAEDFEPTIDNSFWTETSNSFIGKYCGGPTNALYFFGVGNYADDRYATTKDMDLGLDGTIQFDLFISYNSGCESVDYGKDIYLDYSTDGGNTWNNMGIYYAGYNTYDPFTTVSLAIPKAAQTSKTRLRWYQLYYSCISCDWWGLDNVKITTTDSTALNNTYTYSWTPVANLSDATIANPLATVNATTTFQVTVMDAQLGCSGTDTFTLSAFNLPSNIITNNNTTICLGDTLKLESTKANNYLWSTGDTTQLIYIADQGSYSVQTTFAGGCVAADTATLATVVPVVSSINANGATTFCKGGSVQLMATPGVAYIWSNGNTTQSITVSQSGNYYATVYDNNGCHYKTSAIAVVNADPAVTIIEDSTTVCKGTVLQFETQSSIDFKEDFDNFNYSLWADYTGYIGTYCFYTTSSIYFYYGIERYAETVDLNLIKGGNVQFDLYIDYYYYCDPAETGDDVFLQYSTDGGQTWNKLETYYAGTSMYGLFTTVTAAIPLAAQTAATRLRWIQYSFDGDYYDTWGLDNIKIDNFYKNAYEYTWSPVAGLSSSSSQNPVVTIDSTITYLLTVTDTNYGCASTNKITINAEESPKAAFTYSVNGLTVNFTNTSTYTTNYYWIFGDNSVSFDENVSHTYPAKGSYQVVLKTKGNCGYDYDTVMVTISSDGINEMNTDNNLSVYPNPTTGNVVVGWMGAANEQIDIQILSVNGEVIKEKQLVSLSNNIKTEIDLSNLAKGIYYLKFITNSSAQRKMIVLN